MQMIKKLQNTKNKSKTKIALVFFYAENIEMAERKANTFLFCQKNYTCIDVFVCENLNSY